VASTGIGIRIHRDYSARFTEPLCFLHLLKGTHTVPHTVITDRLRRYSAALPRVLPRVRHKRGHWLNNHSHDLCLTRAHIGVLTGILFSGALRLMESGHFSSTVQRKSVTHALLRADDVPRPNILSRSSVPPANLYHRNCFNVYLIG
jgi:hypothetical protein